MNHDTTNTNDHDHPLRSILKRMERSIDDARSRRTRTPDAGVSTTGFDARPMASTTSAARNEDALDTPIMTTKQTGGVPKTPGPVRDERTMFDFDGPRLKARPKRRSAS